MGEACGMCRGEETRTQGLVRKCEGKRPLVRPRYKWENNIKINFKQK
jgi:hypothetical protein